MDTGMQLLDRLTLRYDTFTRQQKRLADYLLLHYREASCMSLSELSERTAVSAPTIVRFAYTIGCSGFPGLVKELQDNLQTKMTTVERLNMMDGLPAEAIVRSSFKTDINNLRITAQQNSAVLIDAVVHVMNSARRLYLVGARSSRPLVEFLDYYLRYMMDNVRVIRFDGSDLYAQTLGADTQDCVVAVCFPRYARQTLSLLRHVRGSGAATVAITDHYTSPPALLCDYALTAKSYMNSFVDSFVAPLALINVLIIRLGLRRRAQLFSNFEQLEGLWRDHEVYAPRDEDHLDDN
ncbi:MAG: MurR/RpiR family transcriptional regulator [Clostridia bacterium]|nr:MurR/RpiR family transcriptional regulator [Clostridia bacterium]